MRLVWATVVSVAVVSLVVAALRRKPAQVSAPLRRCGEDNDVMPWDVPPGWVLRPGARSVAGFA